MICPMGQLASIGLWHVNRPEVAQLQERVSFDEFRSDFIVNYLRGVFILSFKTCVLIFVVNVEVFLTKNEGF